MNTFLNRRVFLGRMSQGLGSLALASLVNPALLYAASSKAQPKANKWTGVVNPLHFAPKIKRVIWLTMAGGPSHLETFDYKPKLAGMHKEPMPESFTKGKQIAQLQGQKLLCYGPQLKFKRVGKSGAEICELFEHIGSIVDEICIIRSMTTEAINHDPAHMFMNTGSQIAGRPSMGAWVTYGLGTEAQDLPGFVVLTSLGKGGQNQPIAARQWAAGFLPSRFQGVQLRSKGDPVLYLGSPPGVSRGRQQDVVNAINTINAKYDSLVDDPEISTRIAQYEMAFQMQASVPALMDLSKEPQAILDLYGGKPGDGSFASNCLLARRLAEQGVRFIQLYHKDWDHHGGVKEGNPARTADTLRAGNGAVLTPLASYPFAITIRPHLLAMSTSPVLRRFPLDGVWPTLDPFLFCVHHRDDYPASNGRLGPRASLEGRSLGADFGGKDGWSMYHGEDVPGFPAHPHRGFETVTVMRRGLVDHADSMGAAARYGDGDVQWLTAGRGVVHSEMFPLLREDQGNPAELFQIWLNLPAASKMAEPAFSMFWSERVPELVARDDGGRSTVVRVVAGALEGAAPPLAPPKDSWASRADAEVAIWTIIMEPGARWTLPAAQRPGTQRALYLFDGGARVAAEAVAAGTGMQLTAAAHVELVAGDGGAEFLLLQGRPIGEAVAQHGPFVMNTKAELAQAFQDYQRTQFGGWPWNSAALVHGPEAKRFARRPDGRVEAPSLQSGESTA